jgi:hypothetical protein
MTLSPKAARFWDIVIRATGAIGLLVTRTLVDLLPDLESASLPQYFANVLLICLWIYVMIRFAIVGSAIKTLGKSGGK